MAENKPKQVKIINSIPALVADGHGIGVNPENGDVNLVFIQVLLNQAQNMEEAKKAQQEAAGATEVDGNIVANIRMTMEQLKNLNEAISKEIANYKPKEDE